MKQLNLHFSDNKDIQVIVVNLDKKYELDDSEIANNFIFVRGNKNFYNKVKLMAELTNEYADPNWDVIDYGFTLDQFNTFKDLVSEAA